MRQRFYNSVTEFLVKWRPKEIKFGRLLTGCFDLLHPGHVTMIENANSENDQTCYTFVGINSDASVRRLKGEDRPIFNQQERAYMLASLANVDAVFIFDEDNVVNVLRQVRPFIWCKGADYTLETLNQEERRAAEEVGTKIVFLPRVKEYSTTGIIQRLKG